MEYRNLGRSGLKVSEVALGGWVTFGHSVNDQQMVRDIVTKAYEEGVNFFDQADVYARGKSEEMMGAVLRELPRHTLVLSSKVYWPMSDDVNDRGLSRKHILESIDGSLRRLGTDYLDIYFAHRYDENVPMDEIVMAFDQVIRDGKALYWGTSMWPAARIAEAVEFARARGLHAPVTEQPEYSMLRRDRVEQEILPYTEKAGIGLVVWSPLAMGLLTGKYDEGRPEGARLTENENWGQNFLTEANIQKVRDLKPIADELGITRAQLAVAWILRQKGVSSVITGATKVQQIEDTVKAAGIKLSDEVLHRIEEILTR
ncbi:aldo/keto reductase [Deinococcus metallilatus]|uniref:Aldo/keto reductase n=1 Tax=Deinococcus metallilatus TaxID=1211322 RepID=A0AAJ5JYZ3_9DEIO|nr:aldo/keto reductase family protein [Deinococcus metallilatus]MBB5296995.1 voltage-dependent potassium channel beta subunit [Deinococcus metallilatus]QBY07869.1 aldo/keto reductase [Deinococcus metallilatus]RXJ13218.1 aldo/keto reductase [Deinococcus metallilatus]TLK23009.1 aldo/keto reductase [Deinococcus metallilatus]GMA15961.1 voltage-gated potassium channel [Deinococcus metallilatus]